MRALITTTPGPRVGPALAIARAAGGAIIEGDVLVGLENLSGLLAATTVDHNRPWLPAAPWVPEAMRDGPEALLSRSPAAYLSPTLASRAAAVRTRFPAARLIALVDCPAPQPLQRVSAGAEEAWLAAARPILAAARAGLLTVIPLTRLHEPPVLRAFLDPVGGTLSPAVLRLVAELARSQPEPRERALTAPVTAVRAALLGGAGATDGETDVTVGGPANGEAGAAGWARSLAAAGMDPEAAEAVAGARWLQWYTPGQS